MIQGMHHVSMKCSNAEEYAAVRAFYTELLRIPVLTEWETGILLDTGAGLYPCQHNHYQTSIVLHQISSTFSTPSVVQTSEISVPALQWRFKRKVKSAQAALFFLLSG